MKTYIKEKIKFIISFTFLIMCTVGLIFVAEIRAATLPVLSETLEFAFVDVAQDVYTYTGEVIQPEISRLVFEDRDGKRVFKEAHEIKIVNYFNNLEVGYIDVEVAVSGYQGTLLLEDVFFIEPAVGNGLQLVNSTVDSVELSWSETIGAQGYQVFRKKNGTRKYIVVADVKSGENLAFTDSGLERNSIYTYYVCAYSIVGDEVVLGKSSDSIKYYTPLDNPIISAVVNATYNSLRVDWPMVAGAAGYQVYRSEQQDGEYVLLAEITDGNATFYTDSTCECGKYYFYYIKVCQKTETEVLYGEASPITKGRTTPNRPSVSGATSDGNTKVTLTWKKVAGAQGYEVFKNNQHIKTIDNPETVTWVESGLANTSEAAYKVRAYCVVNEEKIYGSFSSSYEKQYTIVYNYGEMSEEIAALTQYVGRPYKYGGSSPTSGWDCSYFVQYVFKKHFGVSLPRTADQQSAYGTSVSKNNRSQWKPGDLIFYTDKTGKIGHVAIYLGNGQLIHALNETWDTWSQSVDQYEGWDANTMYSVKRILN